MEEILLEVELRKELGSGKVKDLRGQGFIPAVIYAAGKESQAIKIARHEFLQLLHQHHLETTLINVRFKDAPKQKGRACLVKEIQYDPVLGDVLHVDLNEISLTKMIKVNVPIVPKGEASGVKVEGGSLEHIMWEIEVECLPTNIPKSIEVDISALKLGESIHVKDLVIPKDIKVLTDPEGTVLSVVQPVQEAIPVPGEGEEMKEPEVIKEKKEVPAEEKEEEK
jgi:large subunit ribosomal protein L25